MTTYPRLLDFAGWALVVLAGFVALVAILGIVAVLHASTPSAVARAEEKLHESHYVVQPSRTAVIPLTVCLVLAGLSGIHGLFHDPPFCEAEDFGDPIQGFNERERFGAQTAELRYSIVQAIS